MTLTMLDVHNIVQTGSLLLIAAIIFAESGLLLGLFLPGDTLLIAGGILASQHRLPLLPLILVSIVSTIAGYQLGYELGRRAGPRIFKRKNGVLFREDYMEHTESFFSRHGWKTILVARFIAIVRTIIPLVAGMGKMDRKIFFTFNIVGGVIWSTGLILLSYWVGNRVPNLDKYIEYLILLAVVLTWAVAGYELFKKRGRRREILSALKEEYRYLFKKG
jgi:membrane-associated protein